MMEAGEQKEMMFAVELIGTRELLRNQVDKF